MGFPSAIAVVGPRGGEGDGSVSPEMVHGPTTSSEPLYCH